MGRYFLVKTVDFSRNAIVLPPDYSKQYLTFEALEDGTFSFSRNINYSIDGGETWTTLAANTQSPTITTGNTILWKGELIPTSSDGSGTFSSTGRFNVYGNIMSLVYSDNFVGEDEITYARCFSLLFYRCKVVDASNLILPATTLSIGCYSGLFFGCSSLIVAPELPSTTLATYCYYQMFTSCTSLTAAPELPATTLADNCYDQMFNSCTSLTSAPSILPATSLTTQCYYQMFNSCTSLTTTPELPATTLTQGCYGSMFRDCTSLTTAPELPAGTLAQSCYAYMFYDCTNLNYIKMMATDISVYGCLSYWVYHVSSTGTFVKNANATWDVTGSSGVPSKWTIITE